MKVRNLANRSLKECLLIVILALHTSGLVLQGQDIAKDGTVSGPVRVLFIGSSYFFYNDLPGMFAALAGAAGIGLSIDYTMPPGLLLADHAVRTETREKIQSDRWDVVVLQGVGVVTAYPDSISSSKVYPALQTLQTLITENCSTTKMVFCMPWAYEDGMTWYGWPDTYADMQKKIFTNTLAYSRDLDFPVAPVGWAWYCVLDELGYPLHYLHMSDWNHPSLSGSYLMACVIFSTLFGKACTGNSYITTLPEEEAVYLQQVASSTVLDRPDLWNVSFIDPGTVSGTDPYPLVSLSVYPNPFTNKIRIEYTADSNTPVDLTVYDLSGRKIENLVCAGTGMCSQTMEWEPEDLPAGAYFCIMRAGGQQLVRQILRYE